MKKIIIIFVLFLLSDTQAQVNQEWVATYTGVGTGSNVPSKCLIDSYNNIYVVGRSYGIDDDCITLKYNSSGNLLWERRYNGIGNEVDLIRDAVLDDSNNIYVTGETYEGSTGGTFNWLTIKYKPNGDTAWKRIFSGPYGNSDVPFAIAKDKQNNIYVTGYCVVISPVFSDIYTIKYDSDGQLQWVKTYSSPNGGQDIGYSITTDDSDNVYTTGYGSLPGLNEIVTLKYNTNGDAIWIRKNPTNDGDFLRPTKSITDKFNNIIVNGYYQISDQYAFITIKYNPDGDTLWKRIYKGDGNLNFCFALCTDDSANVYVAGRNTSSITGNDFLTIKYNQYGDTSWIRIYDGGYEQSDEVRSMAVDNLQNVYVTGRTDSTNGVSNYQTIKYDKSGIIQWVEEFTGGFHDDIAYSICLDKNNNAIVTGNSRLNISNSAIRTIKYSQLTNIFPILTNQKYKSNLDNFPNPFNTFTKINYNIFESGIVQLRLYSLLGRELEVLLNEYKPFGEYQTLFNAAKYSSGIYYYSLFLNNKIINTSKMVLVK